MCAFDLYYYTTIHNFMAHNYNICDIQTIRSFYQKSFKFTKLKITIAKKAVNNFIHFKFMILKRNIFIKIRSI